MARTIQLEIEDEVSSFSFRKVERDKLYGRRQRIVVDEAGKTCSPAYLTTDGTALVLNGGTAHVWVDKRWNALEQDERQAVDDDGRPIEVQPSTLGVPQAARIVDAKRVLDHSVISVYQLDADELGPKLRALLSEGAFIEAPFQYRDGLEHEVVFVLENEEGIFALVSRPTGFPMLERELLPDEVEDEEPDELEADLDFSMF